MKKKCLIVTLVLFLISLQVVANPAMVKANRPIYHLLPNTSNIDKALRITAPLLGQKIIGNAWIRGSAKPGSYVQIKITSTYYKLGTDQRNRKMFKGEGPIAGSARTIRVRADGQGFWSTNAVNFRNQGWSQQFKIVATSVEGKNSTYVTAINETKPVIQWE